MSNTFLLFYTASFLFLVACTPAHNKSSEQVAPQQEKTDKADTTYLEEQATKSDLLFDDFLLAYTSDSALQWRRVHFPLRHTEKDGKTTFIEKDKWKMVTLFAKEELYTTIVNSEAELDLSTNLDLHEGRFEWIYPDRDSVSSYYFRKNPKGAWYLEQLSESSMHSNPNGNFLQFYKKFATDTEFQKHHIKSPIDFVTNFTDENEEFNTEHFRLGIEQWLAWQVPMPTSKFTNIVYGRQDTAQIRASNLKVISIKSLDGTIFKALYFRKNKAGEWHLYRYEDTAY